MLDILDTKLSLNWLRFASKYRGSHVANVFRRLRCTLLDIPVDPRSLKRMLVGRYHRLLNNPSKKHGPFRQPYYGKLPEIGFN